MKKMLVVLSLLILFPLNVFSTEGTEVKKGDWLISTRNFGMDWLEGKGNLKGDEADVKRKIFNIGIDYVLADYISLGFTYDYEKYINTEEIRFILREGFYFPVQQNFDFYFSAGYGISNFKLEDLTDNFMNGSVGEGKIGFLYLFHENAGLDINYRFLNGNFIDDDFSYSVAGPTLGLILKF